MRQADTAEQERNLHATPQRPRPVSPLAVDLAGVSDPGRMRPNNEDHFLIARFGRYLESVQTNLPTGTIPERAEETGYALVVADGLGGRAAGEVASELAISTLVNLVLEAPDWIVRLDDPRFTELVICRAKERWGKIHAAITERGHADPSLGGLCSTLTLAASLASDLLIAHIGDSRAYLFRQNRLHRLTRDHTLAQGLADRGVIAVEAVAMHHLRHVLTEALGSQSHLPQPDTDTITLEDGDSLLLCSDGLTEMVSDGVIASILGAGETAATTCQRLLDEALNSGGKDNVTVVVARYRFP